ncbi:protein translocase subunit SecF [Candidatus Kapaibacterium sp.]
MEFFKVTNIDFVGFRKTFAMFSIALTILGLLAVFVFPPVLGIDFQGGAEIAVEISGKHDISEVRNIVDKTGLKGAEIKSFGDANQFLIRVVESDGPEKVLTALKSTLTSDKVTMLKVDKIGPKIGSELLLDAVWALLFSVIAILVYIAFRFDFNFGLGAIVALFHDVILTFSIVVITHHLGILDLEMNQGILAGMLTVIGYSINDTVVIFDRVRENKEKHKGMNFVKLVNMSLNETLSRTINTGLSVLMVLIVIFVFGGPVLQGLVFTMFWGLVLGTYSSIYVASNFVIWRHEQQEKSTTDSGKASKKLATA